MSPGSFNALLQFFWDQRGPALPFYFQVPMGLYGAGEYGCEANPAGLGPLETELDAGYGEGTVYIVRFTQEELSFRFLFSSNWYTESPLELLRVV